LSFEQESDRKRIAELEKTLSEVIDSELSATGGNDLSLINGTLGNRNSATGDAGGIRSNQPIIHTITDVDEDDVSTGVFDKIDIISSMAIIDHTSTPFDLRFIQGIVKDGTRIKITPKFGKTITVKSGGNILTSVDIVISDTEVSELVKYSEAETGVTGGAYKIFLAGSSGGISLPPFIDSDPIIKGSVDPTKLLKFEIDGFTAATTRVITIPNSSFIMAGLSVPSQTWTGENIFVGNTAIRDTSFFIQDGGDITKQLNFELSGGTTGFTLIIASQITGNRTLTFPDSTTVLAGLGVVSQSWTGTNIFVGPVTIRDTSFFIQDGGDITKQLSFQLSGGSTGQVLSLASIITSNRTVTFPNDTTILAGLATTQTFTGVNTFDGNTIFNEDVTLGSSTVDNITFVGETVGDIIPNTTSIDDLGSATKKFMAGWLNFSLNLFGSFSGAGTPGATTGQAKLFTRFNGTKFELRVLFPTGVSQLIATEP